jgi:hypothetical protein
MEMSREDYFYPAAIAYFLCRYGRFYGRPVPGTAADADRHVIDLLPLSWLKERSR